MKERRVTNPNFVLLPAIVLLLVAATLSIVMEEPFRWLFPKNIFYFGKEKLRYDRHVELKSKWIWGIIIAFIVGTASSVLVWYFTLPKST